MYARSRRVFGSRLSYCRPLLVDISITGEIGVVGAKSHSDAVVQGTQVRQAGTR